MSTQISPTLESITVRAKYIIHETNFDAIQKKILEVYAPSFWYVMSSAGESFEIGELGKANLNFASDKEVKKQWYKKIRETRYGVPLSFSLIVVEHIGNDLLVELECKPSMWFKIATFGQKKFTENNVQEALIECRTFVKQVMSIFKAKEVEPVAVYPIIQRTEIKSRLLNLGLKETVEHLDEAERHIVQNNFEESLKSSRTAFEKMIDWEIKKRGLEKTNNYKNDLERLQSKGFIDPLTKELIQTYYRCLSNIAVHSKGEVPPGFHEAQMGYGLTLIMLQYFADKLP